MKQNLIILFFVFFIGLPLDSIASGEIVFTETIDRKPSLFIIDSDGTNYREVAKGAQHPQLSHDGKLLAFIKKYPDGSSNLEISNIEGKVLHKAGGIKVKMGGDKNLRKNICSITWSPDNSVIAFTSAFFVPRNLYLEIYDLKSKKTEMLYRIPVDDLDEACISDIQWIDNGKKIVMPPSFFREKKGIYTFDLEKRKKEFVTYEIGIPKVWGESKIVYMTRKGNGYSFWSIDLQNKKKKFIFKTDGFLDNIRALIPSSKIINNQLVLTAWAPPNQTTYILDINSKNLKNINIRDYLLYFPELSTKGDKILSYGVSKEGEKKEKLESFGLYIYDIKKEKMTRLKKISSEMDNLFSWNFMFGNNKYFYWR